MREIADREPGGCAVSGGFCPRTVSGFLSRRSAYSQTERSQPTRLETRTKESSKRASTTVANRGAQRKRTLPVHAASSEPRVRPRH